MGACDLCGLPTPEPPVSDGSGEYCCVGCRAVDDALDEPPASVDARSAHGTEGSAGEPPVGESAFLAVSGMHCATCEAFLESRAERQAGVLAAEASYPAGLVRVVYDADRVDPDGLADRLSGTGYRARPAETGPRPSDDASVGRLLVGGFLGMMVMTWYVLFLYPVYLGLDPASRLLDLSGEAGTYLLANVWVLATVVLLYTGYPRLRGAVVSLRAGIPNMDLLVALAAVSAHLYSTVALVAGRREVYFDVVVAIVVVVALGKHYEGRVRRRAAGHLEAIAEARVGRARRRADGGVESVAVEALRPGDEVVVRTGERVPVDGVAVGGPAAVDESLLTGTARPRTVEAGEAVVGGARVVDGALIVEVGDEVGSRVDRLLDHLWSVQTGHGGPQRLADRLAAVFVPLAVVVAAAASAWHLLGGATLGTALLAGLVVLVVSCPCALGLATPLAVTRGVREALAAGVVVTDGGVFERGADVDVVVLDKTGTLTTGEMALTEVVGGEAVLARAAAVEALSDHPVGDAVAEAAAERGLAVADRSVEGFEPHPGRGVSADVDGERVLVGSAELLAAEGVAVPDRLAGRARAAEDRGLLPAFVAWGGMASGLVVAGDRPREGWRSAVSALGRGREVVVLTGDEGAAPFGDHPAVVEVFDGVPPEAKAEVIARLRERGTVAMVGDGTNDAPAMAAADVGVAIERGAPLAASAAGVVVTTGDLAAVPEALDLVAAVHRRVRWNLAWAGVYNAVALPAALLGVLTPLLAAAAMAASSLLVVGNSSRPLVGSGPNPLDDEGSGGG